MYTKLECCLFLKNTSAFLKFTQQLTNNGKDYFVMNNKQISSGWWRQWTSVNSVNFMSLYAMKKVLIFCALSNVYIFV